MNFDETTSALRPHPMENAPLLPPPIPSRLKKTVTQPAVEERNQIEVEVETDEDEISQQMTQSYSEISFKSGFSPESEILVSLDSMSLADEIKQRPMTLPCERTLNHKSMIPLNLEGSVHVEGNMTHFVAEDLEHKIRLSSPVTKKETPSVQSSSRTCTPVPLYRQLLGPQVGQLDTTLINDLECEAHRMATSIDSLIENLCGILHSISSITADNVDVYKNAVSKMSDSMDSNIKSMYTMMAKAEEVTHSMKIVEGHAIRIKYQTLLPLQIKCSKTLSPKSYINEDPVKPDGPKIVTACSTLENSGLGNSEIDLDPAIPPNWAKTDNTHIKLENYNLGQSDVNVNDVKSHSPDIVISPYMLESSVLEKTEINLELVIPKWSETGNTLENVDFEESKIDLDSVKPDSPEIDMISSTVERSDLEKAEVTVPSDESSVYDSDGDPLYYPHEDVRKCRKKSRISDLVSNLLEPETEDGRSDTPLRSENSHLMSASKKKPTKKLSKDKSFTENPARSMHRASSSDSHENDSQSNQNSEEYEIANETFYKKIKRKPDFCYYCENEVLNFARHINRKHSSETEVAEIFSLPANSKKRKLLISRIRKKGNYLKNTNDFFKPVRESLVPNQVFLPCDKCLGFYSRKLLHRHKKKCTGRTSQD